MASLGELRSTIMRSRHIIDTQVLSMILEAAQILHAERNVLRMTLDKTSREELTEALSAMGIVFESLETHAEAVSLIVGALDSYITYLGRPNA